MKRVARQIIRLHTAKDGGLWIAESEQAPRKTNQKAVEEYLKSLTDDACLRLVGVAGNANLLTWLYANKNPDTVIEVASPRVCDTLAELALPEVVLFRMQQCILPASLGGWHRFSQVDDVTYRMIAAMHAGKRAAEIVNVLKQHPLYPFLSFVSPISLIDAVHVIKEITDPRWFIDLKNPTRMARLRAFMGLDPDKVSDVCDRRVTTVRHRRCWYLLKTWGFTRPHTVDLADPRQFLWRRLEAAKANGSVQRAVLRTSQTFLAYMTYAWQEVLVKRRTSEMQLFVPESILRADEVTALMAHLRHGAT